MSGSQPMSSPSFAGSNAQDAERTPTGLRQLLNGGDKSSFVLLLITMLIQTIGFGLLTCLSVIYFTRYVNLSPAAVGFGISIAGLAGIFVGLPVGHLADRITPKYLLSLLFILQAAAVLLYPLATTYAAFIVVIVLYQMVERGASAARGALVAKMFKSEAQSPTRAYIRTVANVGFGIGALISTSALSLDDRAVFHTCLFIAALAYVVAAGITLLLPVPMTPKLPASVHKGSMMGDRRFLSFALLNSVLSTYNAVLEVAMPLWIVGHTSAPPYMVPALFVINTVLIILLQVPVARFADRPSRAAPAMLTGSVLLAISCIALLFSSYFTAVPAVLILLLCVIVYSVGEALSVAGSWSLAYTLAPPARHGIYQGSFTASTTLGLLVGSSLVTTVPLSTPAVGWPGMAVLLTLAGLLSYFLFHNDEHYRPAAEERSGQHGLRSLFNLRNHRK